LRRRILAQGESLLDGPLGEEVALRVARPGWHRAHGDFFAAEIGFKQAAFGAALFSRGSGAVGRGGPAKD